MSSVVSSSTLCAFSAETCALQFRLARSLQEVRQREEEGDQCDREHLRALRRLGQVTEQARRLLEAMQCQERLPDAALRTTHRPLVSEEAGIDQSFYETQLTQRFHSLQGNYVAARQALQTALDCREETRNFPVSCVGAQPRLVVTQPRGYASNPPASPCLLFEETHTCSDAAGRTLPLPSIEVLEATNSARPAATIDDAPHDAAATRATPRDTAASPPLLSTAEEQVMGDIQSAIQQMKQGALQMGAMMEQERTRLQSAEELLAGGVQRGHENLQQLSKVSYVREGTQPPWWLASIPGCGLLWRSLLQPLWGFVKQVLMFALVLASTGVLLLLISVFPKPHTYRARPSASSPAAVNTVQNASAEAHLEWPSHPVAAPSEPADKRVDAEVTQVEQEDRVEGASRPRVTGDREEAYADGASLTDQSRVPCDHEKSDSTAEEEETHLEVVDGSDSKVRGELGEGELAAQVRHGGTAEHQEQEMEGDDTTSPRADEGKEGDGNQLQHSDKTPTTAGAKPTQDSLDGEHAQQDASPAEIVEGADDL